MSRFNSRHISTTGVGIVRPVGNVPRRTHITANLSMRRLSAANVFIVILIHIPLVFAMKAFPAIATIHALLTLGFGLMVALKGKGLFRPTLVCSYITGSELIWRGSYALVFWEFGKYAVILILTVAALRNKFREQPDWRGALYIAFMLPSLAVLPYFNRQSVAFNISGPVSLGLSVFVLHALKLDKARLERVLLALLAPSVGLGVLAAVGALQAGPQHFTQSTKLTSAGIGPNQVSSTLGMGMLVAFLLIFVLRRNPLVKGVLLLLVVWLVGESALTFSRGGLWTGLGAIVVASYYLLSNRRQRAALLSAAIIGGMLFAWVLFPVLDSFTHGSLGARLKDPSLTGRAEIMKADVEIFEAHPLLGVGPGQSYSLHQMEWRASNAHTEFTRLLAEHGLFGVGALLLLLFLCLSRWRQRTVPMNKGVALAFSAMALLFMFHAAMRLVLPGLLFGLGGARVMLDDPTPGRARTGEFTEHRLPPNRHVNHFPRTGLR